MRYKLKTQSYPKTDKLYQITTPSGVISCTFECKKLALERFKNCPEHWHLIETIITKTDITPKDHKGVLQLHMSERVIEAAAS
jgi:hypothetical protein